MPRASPVFFFSKRAAISPRREPRAPARARLSSHKLTPPRARSTPVL